MLLISVGGIIFFTLVIECNAATFDLINPDIIANNVDRSIDLATQLAKLSYKITLKNNGKGEVKSFLFAVEPNVKDSLSYIGAQASKFNTGSVYLAGAAFAGVAGRRLPRSCEEFNDVQRVERRLPNGPIGFGHAVF